MLQNVQNAMVHAQPMLLGEPYVGLAAAIYVLFVLEVGGDVMSLGEPYAKGSLRRARSFLVGSCGMDRAVLLGLAPPIVKTYAWLARNFAPAVGNPSPVAVRGQPIGASGVQLTMLEGR